MICDAGCDGCEGVLIVARVPRSAMAMLVADCSYCDAGCKGVLIVVRVTRPAMALLVAECSYGSGRDVFRGAETGRGLPQGAESDAAWIIRAMLRKHWLIPGRGRKRGVALLKVLIGRRWTKRCDRGVALLKVLIGRRWTR